MPDYQLIYQTRAQDYHRLVSAEDYQGNLLPALESISVLKNTNVVEFGAGTGRVTALLLPLVKSIIFTDISAHMLTVARNMLGYYDHTCPVVADNYAMPLRSAIADITIAGWSFGHATDWQAEDWQTAIGQAINEMLRLLRPSGTAIIIETLGTGSTTPHPPNETLATYYHWLEKEQGFAHKSIHTDYQFATLEEAERLTRFFFGDELAERVVRERLLILPECTGLWWITKPQM